MILINPKPERVPDDVVFQTLKEVCSVTEEQKISELRKLLKLLEVRE